MLETIINSWKKTLYAVGLSLSLYGCSDIIINNYIGIDGFMNDPNKNSIDGGADEIVSRDLGIRPDTPITHDAFYFLDAPVSSCYSNNFNEDSDLDDLVIQNGVWLRDPEGYLKQAEIGDGYRMAYLNNRTYADFDATVRVRVPSGFTGDSHTGLLFRYTRESEVGYDYNIDRGYILEIEEGDGSSFELTLEDAYNARLFSTRVPGAFDMWHTIQIRARGSTITGYFNGEGIFTLDDPLYTSGKVGFGSHASESNFDDLGVCED